MLERLSKEEVLNEYVLGQIIRYNNRRKLQNESVAEHTCFVSMFCLKILAKLNLSIEIERQVLVLAALHDMPESVTSDIPHNVKKAFPELEAILGNAEQEYYEKNWNKYLFDIYNPDELARSIVELADAYSVYQYTLNEKELGNFSDDNNEILHNALKRVDDKIEEINKIIKKRGINL